MTETSPYQTNILQGVVSGVCAAWSMGMPFGDFNRLSIPSWCDDYLPLYDISAIKSLADRIGCPWLGREPIAAPHRADYYSRPQLERMYWGNPEHLKTVVHNSYRSRVPARLAKMHTEVPIIYWHRNEVRNCWARYISERISDDIGIISKQAAPVHERPLFSPTSRTHADAFSESEQVRRHIRELERVRRSMFDDSRKTLGILRECRSIGYIEEAIIALENTIPVSACPLCADEAAMPNSCPACKGKGWLTDREKDVLLSDYGPALYPQLEIRLQGQATSLRALDGAYIGLHSQGHWYIDEDLWNTYTSNLGRDVDLMLEGWSGPRRMRTQAHRKRCYHDSMEMADEDMRVRLHASSGMAIVFTMFDQITEDDCDVNFRTQTED